MKTVMKIALGIVLACVLLIGGCMALLGGVANEVDKELKEEAENDRPKPVAVGKAFTHDGYAVAGGWKVTKDALGSADITGMKVTNSKDERNVIQFTFTFVKGDEVLGEVECNGGELEPGQKKVMDCFSTDDGFPTGYTEVRVADMW